MEKVLRILQLTDNDFDNSFLWELAKLSEHELQVLTAYQTIVNNKNLLKIMNTLDDIETSLQGETDAQAGVITLLGTISDELKAVPKVDPTAQAKIDDIVSKIDNNKAALAAAIVANTPAAPGATGAGTTGTTTSGSGVISTTTPAGTPGAPTQTVDANGNVIGK